MPGTLFGEVAMLYGTRRTASVRTKEQCTIGSINEEAFFDMLNSFPEVEKLMKDQCRKYADHWKKYQINVIQNIDYLQFLPYWVREELHYKMRLENFERGARVFSRGMESKQLYFVVNGELELVVD